MFFLYGNKMEFVITDIFMLFCPKLEMMSEEKRTLTRLNVVGFAQRNTTELIAFFNISYGSY